jgi:hypothetical protein
MIVDPAISTVLIFLWFAFMMLVMFKRLITWYWGMLVVALGIGAICGITQSEYVDLVAQGPLTFVSVLPLMIIGCIFAASIRELGVAEAIVKKAIELGGDRPFIVCILILAVWAYISIGMPGPAGVILVGTITLPVMMAMGVEPIQAVIFHGIGWTVATPMWVIYWPVFQRLTGIWGGDHLEFLYSQVAIYFIIGVIYIAYQFKRMKLPFRWSMPVSPKLSYSTTPPPEMAVSETTGVKAKRLAPTYTFVLPAVPIILVIGFKVEPILAFVVGTVLAYMIALPGSGLIKKVTDIGSFLEKCFYSGGVDAVGIIVTFLVLGWVSKVGTLATVNTVLVAGIKPLAPTNPITYIIFGLVLSLFGFYRGPGNPFALGSLVYPVLVSIGTIPATAIWAMMGATVITSWWADPTMVYNVWSCAVAGESSLHIWKHNTSWCILMSLITLLTACYLYLL